jgi:hypothetical protein
MFVGRSIKIPLLILFFEKSIARRDKKSAIISEKSKKYCNLNSA